MEFDPNLVVADSWVRLGGHLTARYTSCNEWYVTLVDGPAIPEVLVHTVHLLEWRLNCLVGNHHDEYLGLMWRIASENLYFYGKQYMLDQLLGPVRGAELYEKLPHHSQRNTPTPWRQVT